MVTSTTYPRFFLYFNLLILILVCLGFGLNAWTNTESLPPASTIVWIHGLIMFSWYVLIVIQSSLIQSRKINLHRSLGYGSIFLAVGIIISGLAMTVTHYHRPDAQLFATINTFIILNFTILYGLALMYRTRSDYHKRFMTLASVAAMFPGLGRIVLGLEVNEYLSVPLWMMMALVPGAYDLATMKKIHPASWIGGTLIIIGIGFTLYLIENEGWKELLDSLVATRSR
ncbi:hypothetical protein CLV31_1307 [Algoriphagus aquaeductus]|uniref:Uncharacterized protein n=1 Tax=Algoriphagus aquaeductus TaxID=475299 RepID=A0A326RJN3_9BACT|nr:hypothetical protein [Algoriphagus aquaeductus]PZV75751.1 hypothetical protein CLV31_1307 [Algoriphagus aquaeductus]